MTWSDSRIVVRVPVRAQSGDVKVVATGSQVSGTKRIIVEGEVVESLPSSGLLQPKPCIRVTIPFALAEAGPVRLAVYNLMGQQVRVLVDEWVAAGVHRMRWDGRTDAGVEAASGVYWAVLQVSDAVQTAKLALIR